VVNGVLWIHQLPGHLSCRARQSNSSAQQYPCVPRSGTGKFIYTFLVAEKEHGDIFLPVFISVDPARDTLPQMAQYLQDFHPSLIGLVGGYDETKAVCKAYRVYFSTPPNADPKGDYLVDHSIFVYLMDPKGEFVEAFGQNVGQEEIEAKIKDAITEWQKETGKKV